ncbi:hypothetical protein MSUIS_01640 [Mycoplasma suis KI3806]|uniref:Uncharacterized protein n=1 Tax=Mycoplasma suis (strain KI_3806) TaxID=708248 RepID=F0V335_MYCS3|nr:hypothetical protein [Mycoplasma suis]CBZ40257.1 hypothetical protein MSUIS_01640 [Mycoplasma suis KI3806]
MPFGLKSMVIPAVFGFTGIAAGGGFSLASFLNKETISKERQISSTTEGVNPSVGEISSPKNPLKNKELSSNSGETSSKENDPQKLQLNSENSGFDDKVFIEWRKGNDENPKKVISKPIKGNDSEVVAKYVYKDPTTTFCDKWVVVGEQAERTLVDSGCQEFLQEALEVSSGHDEEQIIWLKTSQDNYEVILEDAFPAEWIAGDTKIKSPEIGEQEEWTFRGLWTCRAELKENKEVNVICYKNSLEIQEETEDVGVIESFEQEDEFNRMAEQIKNRT